MAEPSLFRHYLIVQDTDGNNVELTRNAEQVNVLGFDTQRLEFVHCHVLLSPLADGPGFEEGCRKLQMNGHPLLARLMDFGEDEGNPFYITSNVDGESLAGYLARQTDLPGWLAVMLASRALDAAAALCSRADLMPNSPLECLRVVQTGPQSLLVQAADYALVSAAAKKARGLKTAFEKQAKFLKSFLDEKAAGPSFADSPLPAADFTELLGACLVSAAADTVMAMKNLRAALVKRVLSELGKRANDDDKAPYETFWDNFGAVLKEGLYEDATSRDEILKLARFRSTSGDGWISLTDYVARMKEGQKAIYYIAGEQLDAISRSAQLEGFRAKGIEVLLLTDPIDEFWIPAVEKFGEAEFRSVTRSGADLAEVKAEAGKDAEKKPVADNLDALISFLKLTLKDDVKDVRVSERLTDSACCLVADSGDMDMHLERLLRQHKRLEASLPRVLEINGSHKLIGAMAKQATKDGDWPELAETAWLLLDQARIQDGEPPADPAAFVKRLNAALAKGI